MPSTEAGQHHEKSLRGRGGSTHRSVFLERQHSILLEVDALTKRYGEQTALDDVPFAVQRGEVLGLIRPDGAGKTTLLETIAGSFRSIRAACVGRPSPCRKRVDANSCFTCRTIRPYGDQHVARVLSFVADVYQRSPEDLADVVAAVGLRPALCKRVHSLSKGFNRRLMLAIGFLAPIRCC